MEITDVVSKGLHLGEECPCKNPSCMSHYQFIYNTLELIEDEKKQNELYDLFLN